MKHGNWVPISKAFTKHLPKERPYTELEAAYSMQVDYDNGNTVTVAGYSDLWQWSRNKIYRFLERIGVTITYPENTKCRRNQKGHIAIHKRDINGAKKGQIRLIDSKGLQDKKNINGAEAGHKKDISRNTTNDPNPNPDKKREKNAGEYKFQGNPEGEDKIDRSQKKGGGKYAHLGRELLV